MMPGVDTPKTLAPRWDRREDFAGDPIDLGWIGEDANGIWMRRHPEAILSLDDDLHEAVTAFAMCSDRELRLDDIDTCSHWWAVAWATQLNAFRRRELRELKERSRA